MTYNLYFHFTVTNPEIVPRAVALWLLKSRELHKIPISVMNSIIKDIQSLLNVVVKNLQSNIMSVLECAANTDEIKKRITQHFDSSAYNIFNQFQTKSMQESFFRQHFNFVVCNYIAYNIQ